MATERLVYSTSEQVGALVREVKSRKTHINKSIDDARNELCKSLQRDLVAVTGLIPDLDLALPWLVSVPLKGGGGGDEKPSELGSKDGERVERKKGEWRDLHRCEFEWSGHLRGGPVREHGAGTWYRPRRRVPTAGRWCHYSERKRWACASWLARRTDASRTDLVGSRVSEG